MEYKYGQVVLITGASSGIGKATARLLIRKGFRVYGTSRKASTLYADERLIRHSGSGGFLEMIELDVTDENAVSAAVHYVISKEHRIDILINNAGYGLAGAVEDTSLAEAKALFDVNFFGALRMIHQVLPYMQQAGNGLIINISSVAGYFPIPFQSIYCASKHSLQAMSEALRTELKPYNIQVALVEPGIAHTAFTKNRIIAAGAKKHSRYNECFSNSMAYMESKEHSGLQPEKIANALFQLIRNNTPPIHTIVSFKYKPQVLLKRLLPSKMTAFLVEYLFRARQ